MQIILISTLSLVALGVLVGAALVFAGKKFRVETDEKEAGIRECLPGNNCGACGYAGCDAMASAISKGDAPVNSCPVGGNAAAEKIAAIMGVEAGSVERKVAFVRCKGSCEYTKNQGRYIGIQDCRSAAFSGLAITDCTYGCMGLGSCVSVCPEKAIRVKDGAAVVDRRLCLGCGLCAKACPRGLIELVPASSHVSVQCSNKDKGPLVKKVCQVGCIGCGLCTRQCESGAIAVDNNLAHVDYAKCVQCGACAEKCPVKVITPPVAAHAADDTGKAG